MNPYAAFACGQNPGPCTVSLTPDSVTSFADSNHTLRSISPTLHSPAQVRHSYNSSERIATSPNAVTRLAVTVHANIDLAVTHNAHPGSAFTENSDCIMLAMAPHSPTILAIANDTVARMRCVRSCSYVPPIDTRSSLAEYTGGIIQIIRYAI